MTYTTPDRIRTELRLEEPFSNTSVPSLETVNRWIEETGSYIDTLAARTFTETQTEQIIDYDGTTEVYLKHTPVVSIESLEYSSVPIGDIDYPQWSTLVENTNYYVNEMGVINIITKSFTPRAGNRRMKVTYTHGYTEIPGYVQMLATKLVAKRVIDTQVQNDINDKKSGKSINIGGVSVTRPVNFGVQQYSVLKNDIAELESQLLKGESVYRYTNY